MFENRDVVCRFDFNDDYVEVNIKQTLLKIMSVHANNERGKLVRRGWGWRLWSFWG